MTLQVSNTLPRIWSVRDKAANDDGDILVINLNNLTLLRWVNFEMLVAFELYVF